MPVVYRLCAKYRFGPFEDFAVQTSDPSLCAIIVGSRNQTLDLRICCGNLGFACNLLRFATKPRASVATNPLSIAHTNSAIGGKDATINRTIDIRSGPGLETLFHNVHVTSLLRSNP